MLATRGSRTLGALMSGSPLLGHLGGHLSSGSPVFSSEGKVLPAQGASAHPVNPSGESSNQPAPCSCPRSPPL